MKTISENGLSLIKRFEGCSLIAYDDLQPKVKLTRVTPIKGTLTIGWGHTGIDVYIGKTITQEEADALLVKDLAKYIAFVNNPYYVPLTDKLNQNQFDALVSFCYNTGQGNLKTLCENRTLQQISAKIPAYNKAGGKVLLGLTRRREAERLLFDRAFTSISLESESYRIEKLERRILVLESTANAMNEHMKQFEAPQWIIEDFPEAENFLSDKSGTYDFWRAYYMALKLSNSKYGK
jgi:GH24 family phage-related lysozyme (muramidase)